MESLYVEAGTFSGFDFVADLFPNALSDFVAWSLAWPTEVAVYFKGDKLFWHVHVFKHEIQRVVVIPYPVTG